MAIHNYEKQKCKIALELGWLSKKGPMMPCKACSVGKGRQLAINKYMDDSKKTKRCGKRMFSDLVAMKAPQDSDITIINKNWHNIVDQYAGYKDLEFYSTKKDFMESMCKKLSNWKNNGNGIIH